MSKPPMKAVEAIKRYCEKTQCRRCAYGKREMLYSSSDTDYISCALQERNPCDWEIGEEGTNE